MRKNIKKKKMIDQNKILNIGQITIGENGPFTRGLTGLERKELWFTGTERYQCLGEIPEPQLKLLEELGIDLEEQEES